MAARWSTPTTAAQWRSYPRPVLWLTTAAFALQAWLRLGTGVVAVPGDRCALGRGRASTSRPAMPSCPGLVRREMLPAANALTMMTFGLGMTIGPLAAGVLVASVGFGWTYTLDVVRRSRLPFGRWSKLPSIPPEGEVRKGRPAIGGRRASVPAHPAQHQDDVPGGPGRDGAGPAACADAGHRRGDHRRRRGNGRHPAGRDSRADPSSRPCSPARWEASGGRALAVLWCVAVWGAAVAGFGTVVVHGRPFRCRRCRRRERVAAAGGPLPCGCRRRGHGQRRLPHHHPAIGHARRDARAAAGRSSSWWWPAARGSAMRGRWRRLTGWARASRRSPAVSPACASSGLLHRLQPRFARYDDRHPEP